MIPLPEMVEMELLDHGVPVLGIKGYTADQMRAYGEAVRAEERELCAQYMRDSAARLAPDGKRTNQVDRHTAHVLATKGDELAAGFAAIRTPK